MAIKNVPTKSVGFDWPTRLVWTLYMWNKWDQQKKLRSTRSREFCMWSLNFKETENIHFILLKKTSGDKRTKSVTTWWGFEGRTLYSPLCVIYNLVNSLYLKIMQSYSPIKSEDGLMKFPSPENDSGVMPTSCQNLLTSISAVTFSAGSHVASFSTYENH